MEVIGPISRAGLLRVALGELLDPVGHLAGLGPGGVVDLFAQVVDDGRHVVHEVVGLVDERRHDQREHAGDHSQPAEQPGQRADRARDLVALLQPIRDRGQRDGDDHRDQHGQQEREELVEHQAHEQQPRGQQDRAVGNVCVRALG